MLGVAHNTVVYRMSTVKGQPTTQPMLDAGLGAICGVAGMLGEDGNFPNNPKYFDQKRDFWRYLHLRGNPQ